MDRTELKTPLLNRDDNNEEESRRAEERDDSERWTEVLLRKSLGALLILNFALAYYFKGEPVCSFILLLLSLQGPLFFLITARLYRQTYHDATMTSLILLILPEIMMTTVSVLLLICSVDEAGSVIFVCTFALSLFVVVTTGKLLFCGAPEEQQHDDYETEPDRLTDCRIV